MIRTEPGVVGTREYGSTNKSDDGGGGGGGTAAGRADDGTTTMWVSVVEGVFSSAALSFGDAFYAPFAISRGAGDAVLGALVWAPSLAGAAAQVASAAASTRLRVSRRRVAIVGSLVQSLLYGLMAQIARLPVGSDGSGDSDSYGSAAAAESLLMPGTTHGGNNGISDRMAGGSSEASTSVVWMAVCAALCVAVGGAIAPAWLSWMGQVVPRGVSGRYFGRRAVVCGLGGVASAAVGSWAVGAWPGGSAYPLLFSCACASRLCSCALFVMSPEPATTVAVGGNSTTAEPTGNAAIQSAEEGKRHRRRSFVIVLATFTLSNVIAGTCTPFYVKHATTVLSASTYVGSPLPSSTYSGLAASTWAASTVVATVSKLAATQIWGRIGDSLGHIPAFLASLVLGGAASFVWACCVGKLTLFLAQCVSGTFAAGQDLLSFTAVLAATEGSGIDRQVSGALFNAAQGVATALGSVISAYNLSQGYCSYTSLFATGAILRLLITTTGVLCLHFTNRHSCDSH
ncbi:hypothetical protein Pelo_18250 [Pelomyxa schiedti]|nr:hypothetical protein Pelo_18250 [Pelomyxa schiedti]